MILVIKGNSIVTRKSLWTDAKGLTIDILASKRNLEDLIKCVWLKMKI